MPEHVPLVSIITVCYNSQDTITKTIESVLSQTYNNIEYIIVDGESNDNTVAIIKSFGPKISKFISEKDNGIYDAMNKGISMASGEIIGIINSDDFYEKDAVEKIIENYQPGLYIYHGSLRNINSNNESFVNPAPKSLSKLKRGMVINHPTVFVNKEVYDKIGMFSTKYRIAADWDFILNAFNNKITFIKIEAIIANFTLGGVSGSISVPLLKEINKIRKNRNLYKYIDLYYLYDLVRYKLLGNNLYRLYLLKKKLFNA